MLELAGYNVITASDESLALKAINERQVDLAVIDYHMAVGPNGDVIAQEIRAINPTLPLLMLTGDPNVPQTAIDSVDFCLIKGANPASALVSVIGKLLSENRGG